MSAITQRIPTFLGGISQQADSLKRPGQLVEASNILPDFALGTLKRPGGKYEGTLLNASTGGKWFSILRDENEKYVAQYDDNIFRVWDLQNNCEPMPVDMGLNTGVPSGCNVSNLETDLAAYKTASDTLATKLGDLNTKGATYAETRDNTQDSVSSSLVVNYFPEKSKLVQEGRYDPKVTTGVLVDPANNRERVYEDGAVLETVTIGSAYATANKSRGDERTSEHPLLKRDGYRVYELRTTTVATKTYTQRDTDEAAVTTAETAYNTSKTSYNTAQTNYQSEVTACNISDSNVPTNAYLKDATADDIELLTINDYTFVLNKAKTTAMTTDVRADFEDHAFVVVTLVGYSARYEVKLEGTGITTTTGDSTTPSATSGTVADSKTIVADLVADINGTNGFTAVAVGPGVYISRSDGKAFTAATTGSTREEGLFAFTNTLDDISKLPRQCHNGYIVRIRNNADTTAGDQYVKFVTDEGAANGPGIWEETMKPGLKYKLDPLTMPHQLVRQANGTFKLSAIDWTERVVGDDETNPIPEFIGSTLNNIFIHRNRLGFLSNDKVFLGRARDLFNLFGTTATQVQDDDPIDLQAVTKQPVNLRYAEETSIGLVLYSDKEQFVMVTTEFVLSPKSVKLTSLSKYECDDKVSAVNMGPTQAFISKTPLWTRVFELAEVRDDQPPRFFETSSYVSELVPATVNQMIGSPALSLLSIGETGKNTIFHYRFYQTETDRISSWFKWKLTGTLLHQFFDVSTYYSVTVTTDDDDAKHVVVQSYDLTQEREEGFLTLETGQRADPCMDMFNINPRRTYDSSTKKTKVYLPYQHVKGAKLSVIDVGSYIGSSSIEIVDNSSGSIYYPTVTNDSGGDYALIDDDLRGKNILVGYVFDMEVKLPKIYVGEASGDAFKTDSTADLIVHRIKVDTLLSGPVTYKVEITGRSTFTEEYTTTLPQAYLMNSVNMVEAATHEVPVYQRNLNTKISITSDTPFPISLLGYSWEGNYRPRNYARYG